MALALVARRFPCDAQRVFTSTVLAPTQPLYTVPLFLQEKWLLLNDQVFVSCAFSVVKRSRANVPSCTQAAQPSKRLFGFNKALRYITPLWSGFEGVLGGFVVYRMCCTPFTSRYPPWLTVLRNMVGSTLASISTWFSERPIIHVRPHCCQAGSR